jgi:hypothetical protein
MKFILYFFVLSISSTPLFAQSTTSSPEKVYCGMRPNGSCFTGVTIGNEFMTNKCLKESEALSYIKRARSEGMCDTVPTTDISNVSAPSSYAPVAKNYHCGISPNGSCFTGFTVGGVHVTNKCLDLGEVFSIGKGLIKNGICHASPARCMVSGNGNCYFGVKVNGVHITNKCISENEAFGALRTLRSMKICL